MLICSVDPRRGVSLLKVPNNELHTLCKLLINPFKYRMAILVFKQKPQPSLLKRAVRDKRYLKTWWPISLIIADAKITSKALEMGIKKTGSLRIFESIAPFRFGADLFSGSQTFWTVQKTAIAQISANLLEKTPTTDCSMLTVLALIGLTMVNWGTRTQGWVNGLKWRNRWMVLTLTSLISEMSLSWPPR